jgi:hypothetical protein
MEQQEHLQQTTLAFGILSSSYALTLLVSFIDFNYCGIPGNFARQMCTWPWAAIE